jgi:branched-chain amino acid transport system ATP-binding protein
MNAAAGADALLSTDSLTVTYGSVIAVRELSLRVAPGECVCILGANGAGKSSTLNALMGIAPTTGGTVVFDGQDITKTPIEGRVHRGLTLCPEGRRIFARLTVEENLRLAAAGMSSAAYGESLEYSLDLFPVLREKLRSGASFLSGGQQQQLAIARALMRRPKLMMLDEPSLGLDPILTNTVFVTIERLHRHEGLAILLVEQNAERALALADRGYVLATGSVVMQGAIADLPLYEIEGAYLGLDSAELDSARDGAR